MTEENVRIRMKSLLEENKMSVFALAKGQPSLQRKLNNQINGNTTISLDTILLFINAYKNISLDWLLRGCDEKEKSVSEVINNENSHHNITAMNGSSINANSFDRIIEEKENTINMLKSENEKLWMLIHNMTSK